MNNNYLEIEIITNNTKYQVAGHDYNEVDINSIRIQDRADWAFVRGSFKIITSRITQNIAPYSLCRIRTLNDSHEAVSSSVFLISSTTTHNFTKNVYIHECELLSLEAILECFILGSKAYTDEENAYVMLKTIQLINQKYNVNFDYYLNPLFGSFSDYTFGTGTTLYEVCKQVAEKTNLKFRVNISGWNVGAGYEIAFYQPTTPATLTINNSSNYVMNIVRSQNVDNYCKFLETEASNVVDRDITTKWKDISVRSTYVKADTEHQQLVLPTNVEAITKFSAKGSFNITVTIILPDIITSQWIMAHGGTSFGNEFYLNGTYQDFINMNVSYGSISNVFQYFYDYGLNAIPNILTCNCQAYYSVGESRFYVNYNQGVSDPFILSNYTQNYTNYILEEQEFNTKSESDKTKYCMYKSGSNIVDNMNASYRDNFWGLISGQAQYNFLSQNIGTPIGLDANNYCFMDTKATYNTAINYLYDIEAVTITNPIIIDEKNSVEENESAIKSFGRSYQMGDSNGMPIYFDALIEDIDKQNETLGRIEAIVDIDTSGFAIGNMPTSNMPVILYGTLFYVSSLEHRFTASRRYTQLNLAKTPYKIADAIGVDYQYNSIKIPMQGVIDRAIYYEVEDDTLINYIENNHQVFLNISGYGTFNLAKRVSIASDSNNNYYLYCEAIDNYSFDKGINNPEVYDVPYCDSTGKTSTMSIMLIVVGSLDRANSNLLPDASVISQATFYEYASIVASQKYIYKDTRERLTFTIKVKPEN